MSTKTSHIDFDEESELGFLTGPFQREAPVIEDALGVAISARGSRVIVHGENSAVERALALINELREINRQGYPLRREDVQQALASASGMRAPLGKALGQSIPVSPRKKPVVPKTANQIKYINAIKKYDMVFGIGPAGTGKTYLAMAMAINALLHNKVNRVVLARPAVEAGEKLGFLPGDILEKVNPYLRPLYDALYDMMEVERAHRLIERGTIEVAPLAFMRGRTLNDSFIILDEAQNTTYEQMKMYLTRLGFNSKTVITGDITQIDLPSGTSSGLVEAEKVLSSVEGIKVVYFSERDVVRHKLVQKIVKAYERHERQKA